MSAPRLVTERIGHFFVESHRGRDRLEYTEFGTGEQWVVLLHGLLMPRSMQHPLARALAGAGFRVVTLDLLGHGRSDQPADPLVYSIPHFADQVVALLDHLEVDRAVVGGASLGANVALEVAVAAPERVAGLVVEMPVLDNALHAGIVAFVPAMFTARYAPFVVNTLQHAVRRVPRGIVPFWVGVGLDTLNHRADAMAAVLHGVIFGRVAPSSKDRRRISAPTLVIGHGRDPIHPFVDAGMLSDEIEGAQFERAGSILEWRMRPERLTDVTIRFVADCWAAAPPRRRTTR